MYHRKSLPHQLSSHFIEGREDKHWVLSRPHREVLKPVMEKLRFELTSGVRRGTTTAAGRLSAAEKKQEQEEAAGYMQRTGPSGGPGFRRELTHRGLLDIRGQSSNARRSEDAFDMEKVMFQSDLVPWRTEITLMMISWVSPISGY